MTSDSPQSDPAQTPVPTPVSTTLQPPAQTTVPQPGAQLEVTIERGGALGRGVARADGVTLLVARGVPGERVTVQVERAFPRYALARVVAVHTPALARVTPPCPHFAACAGCDWQHLDYPAQLALKRAVLNEQLERIGGLATPTDWPLVPAPQPLEYRDRLEFTPLAADGRWVPAFHDLDGRQPLPIARCLLAPAPFTVTAQAVLDALARAGVLPAANGRAPCPVQRLTVQGCERDGGGAAAGSPGLAVLLHLRAPRGTSEGRLRRTWQQALRGALPALRAAHPELVALALQYPARLGRGGRREGLSVDVLFGPRHLTRRVHGRAYRVPHTAFFQVHPALAGALVAHVVEQVTGALEAAPALAGRPVFDLFGGVGLFALPLAERGLRVVGVDSDREGLRAAEDSARALGLAGCRFERADLERAGVLARLIEAHGPPAAIVCDPPRRGLSAALGEVLAALPSESRPAALVYVSCDGGTFARDAARLAPAWRLSALRGFDLFAQTHHLEVAGTFVPAHG
jgi:23S rRNA (uracil1939-C5)-methyltransferase